MKVGKTVIRMLVLAALYTVLAACGRAMEPAEALKNGRSLIDRGEPGEARILLKNLLVQHPEIVEARFLLARIALESGDPSAANDELTAVPRDVTPDAESLFIRSRVDVLSGKSAQVLKGLDAGAYRSLSQTQRARLRFAALRASGTPADAIPELRAAMAAAPADPGLVADLATALGAVGNLQQGMRELDAFIASHPSASDALLARAELRLRAGSVDPALQDLRAALAAAPPSWPPISRITTELLLGEALLAKGAVSEARSQLEKIDRMFPGSLGAQLLGARIALFEGRDGDAADALQQLDESAPGDARVQYLLAEAYLRGGNRVRAMEVLRRRVQTHPEELRARSLLARLLLEQGRPDQVVELLGEVETQSSAEEAQVDGLLNAARKARANAVASIQALTERLGVDRRNARVRAELAAAHLANGDPSQALAILRDGRGTSIPDFSQVPSLAVATEVGALRALRNDRELTLLVEQLLRSAPATSLLAASDAARGVARNEASARLIAAVLQRDPKSIDGLLRQADLAFVDHRYTDAKRSLQQLIEIAPERSDLRLAMARVAEAEGDVDLARRTLRAAIDSDSSAIEPALALASLELRAGSPPAALKVIDALIAASPEDGRAALEAGQLLLAARRPEEARIRFGKGRDQAPTNSEVWFGLGRAQLASNDAVAARESFMRAVQLRPDWLEANVFAIRLAASQRDIQAARRLADALLQRLPEHPVAWLLAGQVAALERRPAEASRAFARSYALRQTAAAAVSDFEVRAASGLPRPEQPLQNWLAREPRDVRARRLLSDFMLRTGRNVEARRELEALLVHSPNDIVALNNLAWLLATTDVVASESLARRAYSIAPDNAAVADTLGWVLVLADKPAEARGVLARAAEVAPDDRSILYHYAMALSRTGDLSGARLHLERALAGNLTFRERASAETLAQELKQ